MAKAVVANSRSLSLSSRMRGPAAGAGAATASGRGRAVGREISGRLVAEPLFEFVGVLVDGLAAAPGLLGLPGHGAMLTGEHGGGVEDPGANR